MQKRVSRGKSLESSGSWRGISICKNIPALLVTFSSMYIKWWWKLVKGVPRETAILICKNQSKELATNNSKTITTFFVSYEDNYNAQEMISPYFREKVSNDDPKGNKFSTLFVIWDNKWNRKRQHLCLTVQQHYTSVYNRHTQSATHSRGVTPYPAYIAGLFRIPLAAITPKVNKIR